MLVEQFHKFLLSSSDQQLLSHEQIQESCIIKYQSLILSFFVYNKADHFVFHIQ